MRQKKSFTRRNAWQACTIVGKHLPSVLLHFMKKATHQVQAQMNAPVHKAKHIYEIEA